MGYIKKLKNNELVGGTDKHTIYPVTSTEAVFEEITNGNESSFKSQKTINKEQQDELDDHEERIQAAEAEDIKSITINGSTKKFEVDDENNVDLTIYTVDNDPEMPSIASNVEDLRNMVGTSTPVLETSHKTRIETLEGGESVTGSVENKIKTKVDSINSSYQDDNNEYVKYSMTQASGEVTNFNIDETNLKNAITSLNTSISGDNIVIRSGSTPSGTGEAGKIYRYVNSSNNTYTDYMYSGGSWVTLATHDTSDEQAQVAYYTCTASGSGASATKQFVGNGSLTYTPSSGGHIKILMGEANTATGTIYLKFGTTSATDSTKKPLYYNGKPASASNTWEAGETIAVYYDPSANNNTGAYFASNAQGGGGKADLRNIGLLNVYFDGIGTTYATSDKFYVVAGHILKFTLVEQNVPYDSIASAQSRFMIYSHDANDVETTLYRVNGTNLPDKEIVVYVPDDSVCLYIGGRCSRGYKYECKVVDITCEYENTIITENDLYYHLAALAGGPEYKYRINILLPYQNNAVVKIRPKISTPTYQYEIDGVVINNDKTTTSTILIDYSNTQIDYMFKGGYSYIIVFFKKGDNLEVDKSELLSEYDINVEYPETIEELKITDGDKKWDLIGLSKISNNEAKTDFIVLPNLPMRVKMDIPIWMKVSFKTGNRTNRVDLGTYYSGDIVDFSQGSAGVFVDFKRLDNRGFDADFYTRHSKFLGMSLTQIGSNDGNIFERNFDNEKNLGGIMATGPQSIQRFPTIVHVSDAHGDSFRLNAAHDYADYILADLVINTGDNPFFEMKDGVNFVKDIVFSHKTDFANCIGNHDQYTSTLADVFSLNISPFATEYGYHKSTASDITDKCYYFKDLSAQKIRLIVLDVYDGLAYQAYKARISQEQINWFVSTLAATPQDYGVIVVSHQAPHTINAISGKANFNDVTMEPQINALDSDYMRNGKITGNPLGKIIDAFIVKGSVSGSYTQKKATSSANETISYSADFSNVASGVEFIAYINGHTHRDFIGYVADCENNQLNCNVCSTSPLSQTTGYGDNSDIYRDANGVAQDAFNVYTIDRYNHRLGVCRIGSNLSLNLIDRKVMWFDYV